VGRLSAKTIVLDEAARASLDYVCEHWEGAEKAWWAIEWVLSRDPSVGPLLTDKAEVRGFQYDGARSIKQPDLYVIYHV
jgi:hypothetical protein